MKINVKETKYKKEESKNQKDRGRNLKIALTEVINVI